MLIASILLLTSPLFAQEPAPAVAPEAAPTAPSPAPEPELAPKLAQLPEGIAASTAPGTEPLTQITFVELDALLVQRHGHLPSGQDVLVRLLNMQVMRQLAADAGVVISDSMINTRTAEMDAEMVKQGYPGGMAQLLALGDINPEVFRDTMVVSLIQEELTRTALKMEPGQRPEAGQQNAWLDAVMSTRKTVMNDSPFPTDPAAIVASSNEIEITMELFNQRLRDELGRAAVEQAITQLTLLKRLWLVAGEVAPAIWKEACELEIERRRQRHAANPETAGISYDTLLKAQGLSEAIMLEDPAVQATALATVLAWRQASAAAGPDMDGAPAAERRAAGLRNLYNQEKELFDGYYGEQLHMYSLLLRAVEVPDEKVPRSLEDARDYLKRLAPGIPDGEGFKMMVDQLSDEINAATTRGDIGWFGRANELLPAALRAQAFAQWEAKPTPGTLGPVDVPGGVALFWLAEYQPAPAWERMILNIQSELRARQVKAVMPTGGIQIFRDPPAAAK